MDWQALHAAARSTSAEQWRAEWVAAASGEPHSLQLPDFPPEQVQKITNNSSGAFTMRGAGAFYRIAEAEIAKALGNKPDIKCFDFGAGWGRITRLLIRSAKPDNIYAADVDDRLVAAGKEYLSGVNFLKIESNKQIPLPSGQFDVVISNSVFSHLSEPSHRFYVEEIARLMRPGGVFLGTTLGPAQYEAWARRAANKWIVKVLGPVEGVREKLAQGEFVFGPTNRWTDYGIAILPDNWTRQNWSPFEIATIHTEGYGQDINVAIRR